MKIDPERIYFGPEDVRISTSRAATLLGCSDQSVRRYLERGFLRGCQSYPGAYYSVSKLSVMELKAKLRRQIEQLDPLPEKGE